VPISDSPVNTGNVSGTVTYIITPIFNGCNGTPVNYVVTVNPIPTVLASDQSICSGSTSSISITNPNNVNGTAFSWVVQSSSNVTGATAGSGSPINQALSSTDAVSNGTVVYRITPSANVCSGAFLDVTETVNPVPVISNSAPQLQTTICSGTALNFTPSSTITGATYAWTTTVVGSISGVSTSGSGPITDTPVNSANTSGTVTYHITPTVGPCSGSIKDYTVTVQPVPSASGTDITICSGSNATITLNASPQNVSGTTFSWIVIPSSNVTGSSAGNGSTINQSLTLTDYNGGSVIYRVTPTANGCNGPTTDVTTTVNPIPLVDAGLDFAICEPSTISLSGTIGGAATSGVWQIVTGSGAISSSNVSGNTVTATYTVNPSDIATTAVFRLLTNDPDSGGPCVATSDLLNVAINRAPTVLLPANYTVCEPSTISLIGTIGGSATAGLWSIVSGSGSLSATNVSGSTVTATYTVSSSDIANSVTFRLTTNDPDGPGPCTQVYADIVVTINRQARVFAPANLAQCRDVPGIPLGGSIGGSTSTVLWTGGTGTFTNSSDPNSTYNFSTSEKPSDASGNPTNILLTLTALDPDGAGPCTSVSTQTNLRINPLPVVAFTGFPAGSPPQMAENNAPITLTGNQIGGLFTIKPDSANIGSTSANPVDKTTFDPSAAALGEDTVKYTYTNAYGCTNNTKQYVIINPVTNINYTVQTGYLNPSLTWEICAEQSNPSLNNPSPSLIKLIGSPPASQGRAPETNFTATAGANDPANKMNIIHSGVDYYIETKGLPADTYVVAYTYRNQYDAITTVRHPVIVHAAPRANISIANNCIASAINFNDATPVNPVEPVVSWRWDFGDGASSSTKTTSHTYINPNIYSVTLQVTTSFGCTDTTLIKVRVGAVPVPFFKASSICNNDSTRFTDYTTNPNNVSRITKYIWDFGDGKVLSGDSVSFGTSWNKGNVSVLPNPDSISGTYKNPFHKYRNYQTYLVKQTVLTNDGCNNSYQKTIFILPYDSISPKPTSAYTQDFEASSHGWIAQSLGKPLDSSWVWTVPNGYYINSGTKSWWTGLNVLDPAKGGTYNANESSVVNGPCFNLTHLNRPMIALDYWVNTPKSNNDGASLQYSTDGGANWVNIGVPLQGRNWYSPALIVSNPGNQPVGFGPYGWSGPTQKNWLRGSFSLDSIPKSKRRQVRIRIAFAGDVTKNIDDTYSGFAFDNVFVGEKTKNVLIEHFTNANVPLSIDGDTYFNGLYDAQVLFRKDSSDFYDLQYHVRFPTPDALDQVDNNDPSARALYYQIQQAPFSVMDGLKEGKFQSGAPRQIDKVDIDRRALKVPTLSIAGIDTTSQNGYTNHTVSLKLNIVADTVISGTLMAQVALVEDPVLVTGSTNPGTYHNVVRKLLFGSEGVKPVSLSNGGTYNFAKADIEIDVQIQNPSNLHLIGFVQNFTTREVLQSFAMPLNRKKGKIITAIEDPEKTIASLESIILYPNPANGKFDFGLPGDFPDNCTWRISDQRGVTVMSGDFADAINGVKTVSVASISNGVYFVAVGSAGSKSIYKKLVVLNSN
jgi:hypothetical protein